MMKAEYTQRTALLIGADKVADLAKKTVMVFGLGGVGSFVAEGLCRAGIGRLILIDADTFDPSNLNRQLGATTETVGQRKTDVMQRRLLSINPELVVETHAVFYLPDEEAGFIANAGADYIVDAIDTVQAKIGVVAEAFAAGIPVISSMGAGNKLHPEWFEVSTIEKTSVDPLAKIMRRELKKRGIHGVKVVYSKDPPLPPRQNHDGARPSPGSISFVPSVAGLIIAGAVIRDLIGLP